MINKIHPVLRYLIAICMVSTLAACSSNKARDDYYKSLAVTAQAQADQTEARYRALATVANSGDPGAATAATMAIALTGSQIVQPQYIEPEALSWGKVLAMPVATLGGMFIQADVSKNASNNAKEVQMASYASNEAIQLGQQSMVTGLGSQWASGAASTQSALAELGIAGLSALNTAGEQTVSVSVAGLSTAENIASAGLSTVENISTAGFTSNENIASAGYTTLDSVASTGFATVDSVATSGFTAATDLGSAGITGMENISLAGMTDLVAVSTLGMTGIQAMGTAGMTGIETVGLAGMTGIEDMGTAGLTTASALGVAGIDGVEAVGLAGMTGMQGVSTGYNTLITTLQASSNTLVGDISTDYQAVITELNAIIDALGGD